MDVALWLSVSLVGYFLCGKISNVILSRVPGGAEWDPNNKTDRTEAAITLLLWPLVAGLGVFVGVWKIGEVFIEGLGNFAVGGKRDPEKKQEITRSLSIPDDNLMGEDSSYRW